MCFPLPFKMNSPRSAKAAISTFPVDPDGNLLNDGRYTFTWNAENRLIEIVEDGKQKLEMVYDHMGRRTIKKVHSWVNDAWQLDKTIMFVYGNYNEIARYENGSLAKTYIWGEDLSGSLQGAGGVGGLLVVADSSGSYLPQFDASGNVRGYVDANTGAEVASYELSPFGRTITQSGSKADEFDYKFSTKPEDEETGLVYYIHRYYDLETGRWVSRDPIGEIVITGINKMMFNLLYAFVGNNPPKNYDYIGYLGLTRGLGVQKLNKLVEKAKKLCDEPCCKCVNEKWSPCTPKACRNEAKKFAAKLVQTWNYNFARGPNNSDDNVGGYLCWDWSWAFARSLNRLSPKCWTVKEKYSIEPTTPRNQGNLTVHYYIQLNCCNDTSVMYF